MLSQLAQRATRATAQLAAIETLVPVALRSSLQAGPIEGAVWCLLVDNNAAAAKIRQLLPTMEAALRSEGLEASTIRLKVVRGAPGRA
jgi:hypothetical protein